jgi:hypothetical protein
VPLPPDESEPRVPKAPPSSDPATQVAELMKEARRAQREVGTTDNRVTANGILASGEPLSLLPGEEGLVDWTPRGSGFYDAYADVQVTDLPVNDAVVFAELVAADGVERGKISNQQAPGGTTQVRVQPRAVVAAGVASGVTVVWTSPTADPDVARDVAVTFVGHRLTTRTEVP